MKKYFIIHKPFRVLSQFSPVEGKQTLADYFSVARDVYPVGRLDEDSEGLLLLSNDKQLTDRLLNPVHAHEREYWVQVEGKISSEAVRQLETGVEISLKSGVFRTGPAKAKVFAQAPDVAERIPPVRFRKTVPDSWLSLTLTEGKNRQVRKMTAKVGYPTLRLIRYRIENITLENLQPGDMRECSKSELYNLLKI